eukprot:5740485-Amphidinium_carterae.1
MQTSASSGVSPRGDGTSGKLRKHDTTSMHTNFLATLHVKYNGSDRLYRHFSDRGKELTTTHIRLTFI